VSNFARTAIRLSRQFISRARGIRTLPFALIASALLLLAAVTNAQNVTTQHYDNTRSGSDPAETLLTPSTVNPSNFSRLFSQPVDGQI
jgi:hypothetical protein